MSNEAREKMHCFLTDAKEQNASDLHVSANAKPTLRIHGALVSMDHPVLSVDECTAMIRELATDGQWKTFVERGEVDFSYSISGVGRYRVSIYRQRGCPSLAVRVVPATVPTFASLGLPPQLEKLMEHAAGLFLVTGPTGNGKSTTLAALLDSINHRESKHIVTLEDPIEYLHSHDKSLIDQREVGLDTQSFSQGLRAALRQDPDVIFVGEMRDVETISTAVTAAETGHLVLATLHTPDAAQTIHRIIDVFPSSQQAQIRVQLASVLLAVVSQRLLPTTTGDGRTVACEILVNTSAVANLIRTDKVHQIQSIMQTGRQYGMQTMEMHVRELEASGRVAELTAKRWLSEFAGTVSAW